MKEEKKIPISGVLALLKLRDPQWKDAKMEPKFKILYDGWRQAEMRKYNRNTQFFTDAWKRGWLSEADYYRFREYAMQ